MKAMPLVWVLGLVAAAPPARAEEPAPPPPPREAPAAPPRAPAREYKREAGPHRVVEDASITWHDAERDREIPVKLWYPGRREGEEGRLPVLIFSHGLGGTRGAYGYLARHLAGHGYLCVHLEHVGSNLEVVRKQGLRNRTSALDAAERPRDIAFALDRLEDLQRDHPDLQGRIDLRAVAVGGHSYGAYTAMASVGAKVSFPPLLRDPDFRDPRLKAAVVFSPQAPGVLGFRGDSWEHLEVPVLYATGSRDRAMDIQDPETRRYPFEHGGDAPRWLLWIDGADHMTFAGRGFARDHTRHLDAVRMAVVAFLDATLRGDAGAGRWLAAGSLGRASGGRVSLEASGLPGNPDAEGPPRTAVGRVTDGNGDPVPGAVVWAGELLPLGGEVRAFTDVDGRFALPLPPGAGAVHAKGPGTGVSSVSLEADDAGRTIRAPGLVLPPGRTLEGRVVREDGRPLPQVDVVARAAVVSVGACTVDGREIPLGAVTARTDEFGEFRMPGLAAVPFTVEPRGQPAWFHPRRFEGVVPGTAPVLFRALESISVALRVVDALTGEPVPSVTLIAADEKRREDPGGVFAFRLRGGAGFAVEAPGYHRAEASPETVDVDAILRGEVLEVALRPNPDVGSLVLRAVDADGGPLPSLRVWRRDPQGRVRLESGPAGEAGYRLAGLRPGRHGIFVWADGWSGSLLRVPVREGEDGEIGLALARAAPVTLSVRDAGGEPLAYEEVEIVPESGVCPPFLLLPPPDSPWSAEDAAFLWEGADGPARFRISRTEGILAGLPAGRYRLVLHLSAGRKEFPFEVLPDRGATVEGRVD